MATPQELAVRDKKELVSKEEKTTPGRYYVPYGDIFETDEALTVAKAPATLAVRSLLCVAPSRIDPSGLPYG